MGLIDTIVAWFRGASGQSTPNQAERLTQAMNRGRRLVGESNYRGAVAAFDEVLTEVPLYPVAYADRGAALAVLGDLSAAEADLDRAIVLLPHDTARAVALLTRGDVRRQLARVPDAIRDMRAAVDGGFEPAREELDRAMAEHPEHAAASTLTDPVAAHRLCDEGRRLAFADLLGALVCFDRAVELNPGSQEATHGFGLVSFMMHRLQPALAAFTQSLATDPQDLGVRAETLFGERPPGLSGALPVGRCRLPRV